MNKFAWFVIATVFTLALAFGQAWADTGHIDKYGIEASRAGLVARVSTPFVSALIPTQEGWKESDLAKDRARCMNPAPVLDGASHLDRNSLNDNMLRRLVEQAGMPVICLVKVWDSQDPSSAKLVLLSKDGDIIFGYSPLEAFTPWSKVDHVKSSFDTISLDRWSTLGIAPAGHVKPRQAVTVKSFEAPPVKFKTLKVRRLNPEDLFGLVTDPGKTGSID